jgi:FkbM family methyltransferase
MKSLTMFFRRCDSAARDLAGLVAGVRRLKKQSSRVVFTSEGGVSITLPRVNYSDLLCAKGRKHAHQCISYANRPNAESLLRKTVFSLLQSGYIDPRQSIIDIGCWIGDNAVVWAGMLSHEGTVYAVDPSRMNLDFGKAVAGLNGLKNITWVQAVCADRSGLEVSLDGDLEHAQFNDCASPTAPIFATTTLDAIVPQASHGAISLLHVDVEGFEEKVLRGARGIIALSKPVIIFEQHISKEDTAGIIGFLTTHEYAVFMINEVIPGCDLDCRNFIAFHSGKRLPPIAHPHQSHGRAEQVWYAALGPVLLPAH